MSTEIAKAGGSLAIRPDQTAWTPEQQAVLQQSGISNDVTAAELSGFLHLCQRTQLDPFSRQIYLIGRYDKRAGRMVFTPQTGIDGYRVVAHRVVAASGDSFGYEDTLWCDAAGQWRDVWLSDKPPAAAKVTVIRNGQRFSAVALFREYVQTNRDGAPIGMWGKMPSGQIAKCGEALALRKAFPQDLAGVYTSEEMAQADNPDQAPQALDGGHVRRLRPAEPVPDEWSTPAPEQQTAAVTAEPHPPAQAIADAAAKATSRAEWRRNWSLGVTGRLMGAPVQAPDTEQIEELGAYLTRRGTELPEAPTPEEPLDVETVDEPDQSEHDAAVAELRAAAEAARLDNFEEGAHSALGCPISEASAAAIRGLTAQLRSAA